MDLVDKVGVSYWSVWAVACQGLAYKTCPSLMLSKQKRTNMEKLSTMWALMTRMPERKERENGVRNYI